MNRKHRVLIIVALACAVGGVLLVKRKNPQTGTVQAAPPVHAVVSVTNEAAGAPEDGEIDETLPRLVDLGAGKCIPCKMMAPILEELSKEHSNTFEVVFIDVWENPKAGEQYSVRMIPTQVFYDAAGKELFRHEGFFGKEEILAKWQEYGVTVATGSAE